MSNDNQNSLILEYKLLVKMTECMMLSVCFGQFSRKGNDT